MNTSTLFRIFLLIFLSLCVHISSYSQTTPTKQASVVSGGGGKTSTGTFQNFGVIGEPIVSSQIGNGNTTGQIGYIYMTIGNEPYYIGINDSLILVDMYNNINPLQLFWKDKGYDYAKRSGYYRPEEADAMNEKVEECWEWLSVKLNQKKGDDDDESSDDE